MPSSRGLRLKSAICAFLLVLSDLVDRDVISTRWSRVLTAYRGECQRVNATRSERSPHGRSAVEAQAHRVQQPEPETPTTFALIRTGERPGREVDAGPAQGLGRE